VRPVSAASREHGSDSRPLSRRTFIEGALAGSAALLAACRGALDPVANTLDAAMLSVQPKAPTELRPAGMYSLGLDRPRDGFLYIPSGWPLGQPMPLAVLLHGAGASSVEWSLGSIPRLADEFGVLLLGIDSRGLTWDLTERGGYGPDVKFLDRALERAFRYCTVDPDRIALGGFSDGATYALSLGLPNGEFFSHVMAFSPGGLNPIGRHGAPRVFVAHGTADSVLPINYTKTEIVPWLERQGLDVTFEEFAGDHAIDFYVVSDAMRWFRH
jgi:phospholipase/carboxylesterase